MNDPASLVGLRLVAPFRLWRGHAVLWLTLAEGGPLMLWPNGDGCDECDIEHVTNAWALRDATITGTTGLGCAKKLGWCATITTTRGTCAIEMRLEHNGYYDGSLDVVLADNSAPPPSDAVPLEDF